MNSDNETRRQQPPGIAAYRGNGVSISMLCAKCNKPKPQLGSKRRRVRGAMVAICKDCVQLEQNA